MKQPRSMMTSSNGNIFRVPGLLCGNSPVTGEFPTKSPVTRSLDVFFDLLLNKRLSKQSWGWWFETPTCSYDVTVMERCKFRSHKFIRNKWNSGDPHYSETNHSKAWHVSRYFLDLLSQSLELRDDWMSNHFEIWQAIPTQFQGDWKTLQTN